MALIDWVSKKQPTIKTSVFGAKFVAMKHGTEKLWGLRYKCRMMGIYLSLGWHLLRFYWFYWVIFFYWV